MGAIISRFRKEKTTYQQLECLEEKIKDIEEYSLSTQERRRKLVSYFLFISIGIYILAAITFCLFFFPPNFKDRIVYSSIFLVVPLFCIWFVKKGLAWYYERKMIKNTKHMKKLRDEKEKILEKVMEKETYKVAVEILNKFGSKAQKAQTQSLSTPAKQIVKPMPLTPKSAPVSLVQGQQRLLPPTPNLPNQRFSTPRLLPTTTQMAPSMQPSLNRPNQMMPYRRTPYPIINSSNKSIVEKMVDYVIGDGPNNRFAMICRECFMHNGMALQEEYEFATFRCAFCGTINPSKKQRPAGPKLPFEQVSLKQAEKKMSSSSESSSESTQESDKENDGDEVFETKSEENKPQCDINNEDEVADIQPSETENVSSCPDESNNTEEMEVDNQEEVNVLETASSETASEATIPLKTNDEKKND